MACGSTQLTKYLESKDFFLTGETFELLECHQCGTLTTWPQPDPERIKLYYDSPAYISHDSDKPGLVTNIYRFARKITLAQKFSLINKYSTASTILDVGCGTGEFLAYCQRKGLDVTGIEPGTKAREYAKNKHFLNVLEKMELLGSENKTFTTITMWHVLEHFHDPAGAVNTLEKFLQPGGKLIIALPNFSSYDAKHYQQFWAAYDTPRHLVHFNQKSFKHFSGNLGFKVEKIIPQKLDSFYISLLSEKYRGGNFKMPKAFYHGLISNYKALNPDNGHSSLIYILTRKIS